MHTIVIKKEILDRDPWVATSLFEALKESQRNLHGVYATAPSLEFRMGKVIP